MCRSNGFPIRADLLSDPRKTLTYIEKALLPLLASLDRAGCTGGQCLIEIINEPEWCIDDPRLDRCPGGICVRTMHMQRFIALTTAAVHAHSTMRVTVGSASLKWNSDGTADGRSVARLWSDTELQSAYDTAFAAPSEGGATSPPPPPPRVFACERWCQQRYADAHCHETGCLGCDWCVGYLERSGHGGASSGVLDAAAVSRLRTAVAGGKPTLDLYNTRTHARVQTRRAIAARSVACTLLATRGRGSD